MLFNKPFFSFCLPILFQITSLQIQKSLSLFVVVKPKRLLPFVNGKQCMAKSYKQTVLLRWVFLFLYWLEVFCLLLVMFAAGDQKIMQKVLVSSFVLLCSV